MKFSVNIDKSFLENTRNHQRLGTQADKENAAPQRSIQDSSDKIISTSHDNILSDASEQDNNDDKFSTPNLLLEAIHQTRRHQKQSRIHLTKLQNTIEDASASHLQDQIDLVNSYAPSFKTPRYNCVNEYKGLEDCYASQGGGVRCEGIFRDFMRCYRDTRRQYFELREL